MSRKQKSLAIASRSMQNVPLINQKKKKDAEKEEKEKWEYYVKQMDDFLIDIGITIQSKKSSEKGWVKLAREATTELRRFIWRYDKETGEYEKGVDKNAITYRYTLMKKILSNAVKEEVTVEWIIDSTLEFEEVEKK